ncbi:MAG: serine/threonine-protein phosphatase [Holophagaceae bacterium]|nr:serine/threonine-protein phosphatase [Holophagaceae bacterium]
MLIDYAALTHPGRVRKNNEDAYLVNALDGEEPQVSGPLRSRTICKNGLLAAVADGMGGAAAGEVASREGLAAVAVYLFGHWGRLPEAEVSEPLLIEALRGAVEEASKAVLRWSDDDRTARGMGSTLTSTLIWNGCAYLAQIGDSRAYLFRRGELVQLTTDQTLVHEMITAGSLTPEQARVHPQRNMITQALGCPTPIIPVLGKVALRRGDRLLICSDGLHGEVDDGRLQAILAQAFSPRRTLELMLEEALKNGGRDNITALLLALDDPALLLPGQGESPKVVDPDSPDSDVKASLMGRLGRMLGSR